LSVACHRRACMLTDAAQNPHRSRTKPSQRQSKTNSSPRIHFPSCAWRTLRSSLLKYPNLYFAKDGHLHKHPTEFSLQRMTVVVAIGFKVSAPVNGWQDNANCGGDSAGQSGGSVWQIYVTWTLEISMASVCGKSRWLGTAYPCAALTPCNPSTSFGG
jgi:hypothetical protein